MSEPLRVRISREPFGEYFTLEYGAGSSEELEADAAREWFTTRGANLEQVDKALDYAWNFYEAFFTIENPREIPLL